MQPKFRRNLCLFFALVAAVFGALGGCTRPAQPDGGAPELPLEGRVIKIASPGEPVTSLLNRYTRSWARNTGARIEVATYSSAVDLPAMKDASVWVVRPAEMPGLAADGTLLTVPAEYREGGSGYDWNGLLPLYRDKLLKWGGETYALPLLGEAPLCFYRMDLWADPKHRQAFREKYKREIGPPTTWGEFSDIAEFFHSEGQAGQPAPSLPPLPERAEELDYLFHSVAAPYARRAVFQGESRPIIDEELFSYHYNLKTGEPRIDQPGFVYALHLLQKLQEFRPAQSVTQPAQAFANGQAVLCIADASWIARFRKNLPAASIGICAVPGSDRCFRFRDGKEQPQPNGNPVPYVGAGGWVAVVPRPAPHAATAFALFSELSNRTTSMQVVFEPQWGGGVYREEHFRANWQGFELDRAMTTLLPEVVRQTVARPGLKNPAVRLRIPDQRSHQEALVEEVRKALTQNQDARAALQRVARRWSELDRAKNPAQRKNEYLLSLGLTPQ